MESSSDKPKLVLYLWFLANGARAGKYVGYKKYEGNDTSSEARTNYGGGFLLPTKYDTLVPGL
jgi:hypothetical protein